MVLGFNEDYSELKYAWRIPGDFIEEDSIAIGINNNYGYNIENMREYEITEMIIRRKTMSHKNNIEKRKKREICICDRPPHFHDSTGKGKLDSTPIKVPPDFGAEVGSDTHPGPFAAQAFHPSSQKFFGLSGRRNTPNDSPERAGRVLMDDKRRDDDRFYKPRIKKIDRNFAKKKKH